jgi:hypothetical protein
MNEQQDFVDTFDAAMRAERELWVEMKGACPGQPGFNKSVWDKWLTAVSRCNAASRAMRQAFSGTKGRDLPQ